VGHAAAKSTIADAPLDRVQVVPFRPADAARWDAFVAGSRNGTIFHERRFLAYHPEARFDDRSLLVMRGDRLLAVVPAAVQSIEGRPWWVSHPGSTYGGPVVARDAGLADVADAVGGLVEAVRGMGLAGMRIRLSEQAFRQAPADEIEYVLWALGFRAESVELSTTIPLDGGQSAVTARYRSDTARSVRSAARNGVNVEWSADYPGFWRMLEANLTRHGSRPTHTLAEIGRLRELCGDDRIRLAAAAVEGQMAAGIVVFVANAATFHSFYIAQDYAFQQTRALPAVVDFLVRWGCDERFRYFNLGISTEDRGSTVNWGLFTFKEGFGGRGYVRTTYGLRLGAASAG